MKKIQLLNKIAKVGTDALDRTKYEVSDNIEAPDAIMVRSASLHEMEFPASLSAIARCGAGVNNIPIEKCAEQGIVVFNTPGANANGVKELTIAAMLLASRNITGGIAWANSLAGTEGVAKAVEKGKSAYAGCELQGKTLGVIGLGAIGGMVANAARDLGMSVVGYDPYLTVKAAWNLSRDIEKAASYDELFAKADYITLHVPAIAETKNLICEKNISKMKDGVRILNLSRADLVASADIIAALESGKVASYVTDFPTEETIGVPGIIAIPHLGASTAESEDNCAVMAAHELDEYLTNGNITNSVNFPSVSIPHTGEARICILHKNLPHIINRITTVTSEEELNINNFTNGSKGDYAYSILELSAMPSEHAIAAISALDGVIKVRTIA